WFFFSSRRRHTRFSRDWSSDVCSADLEAVKKYGGALASTLALLADAHQGVYKIKGLMDIIRGGQGQVLQARMRAIDEVRSVVNRSAERRVGQGGRCASARSVSPKTERG